MDRKGVITSDEVVQLLNFFGLPHLSDKGVHSVVGERAAPELMSRPLLGGFLKGGVCAMLGWVVAWPLEVARGRMPGSPRARSCPPR